MTVLEQLSIPIVQAPMAGGPSTPALAAAVSDAGGLGFVAAGYRPPEGLADDLAAARAGTSRPIGVNLFAPSGAPADPDQVRRHAQRMADEAQRAGVDLGEPRFDDDHYEDKLALMRGQAPAVVSFTFGCPPAATVGELQDAGCEVWVTVTGPAEARTAAEAGADALVVQGVEAGGHRGAFADTPEREDFGLLALLQLVAAEVNQPLVATGGIATGAAVAAVLAAGASAAALGTALMLATEAATSSAHRAALSSARATGLTRAFTGRLARGIVNRLQAQHSADAPIAYPEIHHLTAPLRARGRQAGDAELINLWAGQAHALAREAPVAELLSQLMAEARQAANAAARRLGA